jgi:hypothetical protein
MNRDNPTSRKLLNVTLFVLLSPLYAVFLFKSEFGVLRILGRLVSEGRAFAFPLLYLLLLGYIASMVWLLWRGSALGPVVILFVTMLLYSFSNISGIGEKRYELQIGAGQPMLGIDVYCNGVNLGRTPLKISEAEFCEKVTPWQTPPKQLRLSIEEPSPGDTDRFRSAKYCYVPQDIFEMYKIWPPDRHRYFKLNRNEEIFKEMSNSRYWWRFEKDGCLGLTSLYNFGGGAGGGRTITIDVNPNVEFPSAIRHLGLLVHHLANSDYQPSPQWLEHFLKYKGLLFMEFYKRAKGNEKLQPALRALVRAEFGIPEEPSERDCARVVDEILDRVERVGCFTVPSLESLAIELVGQAHYRPIVDRFLESLLAPGGGSSGTRSSDIWTTHRRSGKRVRQLPLEYAVRKLCPDELYNRLVYMSRNGAYLDIIGNYPREESVRLITYHLRQVERQGGRFQRGRMMRAMRLCAKIHNPQLEGILRNFIRNNAVGRDNEFDVREFIQSRINTADPNSSDMANWIFHWAPLNDHDKLKYISKLNTSQTHHYLSMLLPRGNQNLREDVIFQLSKNPNLSLDQFIIDSYKWYNSPQGAGHYLANLTDAIVNTDTPAMRRFLTDLWNKAGKDRKTLLGHLQHRQWRAPNMNWLAPLFAELTGKDERLMAAKILSKIDTDDAWQLAEKWAKDTDPDIAATARQQLDIRRNRLEDEQQFIRQANDLIAGKIKPDELLPPGPAYVWNEQEYVPQTQDNKK